MSFFALLFPYCLLIFPLKHPIIVIVKSQYLYAKTHLFYHVFLLCFQPSLDWAHCLDVWVFARLHVLSLSDLHFVQQKRCFNSKRLHLMRTSALFYFKALFCLAQSISIQLSCWISFVHHLTLPLSYTFCLLHLRRSEYSYSHQLLVSCVMSLILKYPSSALPYRFVLA